MFKIKKCVFPSAGYGTRFLPITKSIPKEMLNIVDKPLIEYGVSEAISAGCDDMIIITNKYKKAIEDYFDYNIDIEQSVQNTSKESKLKNINKIIKNTKFSYTRQKQMKGLGDAIAQAESLVGNEPFAVILSDDLCATKKDSVLLQMMKIYEKYPNHCIVAVQEIDIKHSDKYGIISGSNIGADNNLIKIDDMIEKPKSKDALSNLAIIGRYILTPEIFSSIKTTKIDKSGEVQITNALLSLAKKGKVLAYKFDGKRFDCGEIDGFMEANNYFYNLIK